MEAALCAEGDRLGFGGTIFERVNLAIMFGVYCCMNQKMLTAKFEKLGARAKIRTPRDNSTRPIIIDVDEDRRGEFFDIQLEENADAIVLDVQPKDRHLLLMVRQTSTQAGAPAIKDKFLCGHDERHWFVAGIPERAPVSDVITAKESLKPKIVRDLEYGKKGKRKKRHRRKTDTFVRQGEWFFVPASGAVGDEKLVLRNEPLQRGRGKPHMCENLLRTGGTTVYVCWRFPNGLTEEKYQAYLTRKPGADNLNWRIMRRDPSVFVRGRVSHPDHATIYLDGWHRVAMNTENESRAMASIAFLD